MRYDFGNFEFLFFCCFELVFQAMQGHKVTPTCCFYVGTEKKVFHRRYVTYTVMRRHVIACV